MYYTMIDVIWCTEQYVLLRIKILDSTCSCVKSFISETNTLQSAEEVVVVQLVC